MDDLEVRSPRPLYLLNKKPSLTSINIDKLKQMEIKHNYPKLYDIIYSIIGEFNSSLTPSNADRLYLLIEKQINNSIISQEILGILLDNDEVVSKYFKKVNC